LAVIAELSQGKDTLYVPVGEELNVEVAAQSSRFCSPVSFIDPPPLNERRSDQEEDGAETQREDKGEEQEDGDTEDEE
jgi:hypothetical protein